MESRKSSIVVSKGYNMSGKAVAQKLDFDFDYINIE